MVLIRNNYQKGAGVKGPKSGISVHDWAQVNNWRSRPSTNASTRISVSIFSPRQEYGFQPDFGYRRCQTMLEKPYRKAPTVGYQSEPSTLGYIRYLERRNKESEAKLKTTINVLSIQRSKSDLDTHEKAGFGHGGMLGEGLYRERSQLYLTSLMESPHRDSIQHGNKQEMRMGVAVVPRKGLIHLSTNDEDAHFPVDDFLLHGERKKSSAFTDHAPSPGGKTKSLIKRKDILEQVKMGTKLLEDQEAQKMEEEEMAKSLGDYTILDLQSKILEMADARSVRRPPQAMPVEMSPKPGKKKEPFTKTEKSVTLPAIKTFNPFDMKTK